MMARWWKQVCSLPDIKLLATTLNGLVPTDSNKDFEMKKTVLRYCMLSYYLLMTDVTKGSGHLEKHHLRCFRKKSQYLELDLTFKNKDLLKPG